jgi:hypothetical protein
MVGRNVYRSHGVCMHSKVHSVLAHPLKGKQPAVVCHSWLHGFNFSCPLHTKPKVETQPCMHKLLPTAR